MRFVCAILFTLLVGLNKSLAQTAGIYELEKLYDPRPSDGNYVIWKNEHVLIPIMYESASDQLVKVSYDGPDLEITLYQLHEIWADFSAGNCGEAKASGTFETILVPDRAERKNDLTFKSNGGKQWVLVKLHSKSHARTGKFPYIINFTEQGRQTHVKGSIEVKDRVLKSVKQLDFYSDFWQFPLTMADYYQYKPYSEAHWSDIADMFSTLQQINQFSITTSVFWDLYNTRIRPLDEMMIQITKTKNGSFLYDYSNFDSYITLAHVHGIFKQISIHNLFPWNELFFYFDEASASIQSFSAQPGSGTYQEFWEPFLRDIARHLTEKGWLDKTVFFIDERDPEATLDLVKWVKDINPALNFGYSGDFYPNLSPWIQDYTTPMNVVIDQIEMNKRVMAAFTTSLYTSCFEKENQPNLLFSSDLRDIYFLVFLAKAKGYDGMLRWAYNLWSSDIVNSAIYSDLPSGDAHLVYPNGQVSVRYLVLVDALEEINKLETIARVRNTEEIFNATNRYFLINIVAERHQMLSAIKNYLND